MMGGTLSVAMVTCNRSEAEIRAGYALQALAMQSGCAPFSVYLWDEGPVPVLSNRWVRLILDLLTQNGNTVDYLRRAPSKGVAAARRGVLSHIPERFEHVLLLDDDMVASPNSLRALLDLAANAGNFGFIQGVKLELDPNKTYENDINAMNRQDDGGVRRIWFGDAAFLLIRRAALEAVRWDVVTRFEESKLAGEDVAISLMIADRFPCFGAPGAIGYHLALEKPRWTWEAASDALQFELLRGVVSEETLRQALPHLAHYLERGAASGG